MQRVQQSIRKSTEQKDACKRSSQTNEFAQQVRGLQREVQNQPSERAAHDNRSWNVAHNSEMSVLRENIPEPAGVKDAHEEIPSAGEELQVHGVRKELLFDIAAEKPHVKAHGSEGFPVRRLLEVVRSEVRPEGAHAHPH